MDVIHTKLTVFFEAPFWVGMYERNVGQEYQVCKIIFGAEPKDYEVYDYMLTKFSKLRFSSPQKSAQPLSKQMNPKRMQRQIKKQLQSSGTGTKSMQTLKLQQEQNKQERKTKQKFLAEEAKADQRQQRIQKKKEKHKGH